MINARTSTMLFSDLSIPLKNTRFSIIFSIIITYARSTKILKCAVQHLMRKFDRINKCLVIGQ